MKILISGEGGQGIQTIAKILSNSLFQSGYEVSYMPHYGVEMRMGISMAYLQFGGEKINYPKFSIADVLIVATSRDLKTVKKFIDKKTNVVNCTKLYDVLKQEGIPRISFNMLVLGLLVKVIKKDYKIDIELIKKLIRKKFNESGNIDAFMKGLNLEKEYYSTSLDSIMQEKLDDKIFEDKKIFYKHLPSRCKGCGLCIEKCPQKALALCDNKNYFGANVPEVDLDKCIACGICQDICPDMAIKVRKKK